MQNSFEQVTVDILILWIESAIILICVGFFFLVILIKILKVYRLSELIELKKQTDKIMEALNGKAKETEETKKDRVG